MLGEAPWWLPAINALLIGISGISIITGYVFIKRKQIERHRWSMITGTTFAALFLVVYVSRAALFETKLFPEGGWLFIAYLANLVPHVVLAILLGPMVLLTLFWALRGQFRRHRRIARFTLPMWIYVVISGWIVFFMLYQPWAA